MLNFIVRRLIYMIVTLFFIAIISFVLIELPPGSYLETEILRLRSQGGNIPEAQIRELEARYGVRDPLYVKFGKWFSGVLTGDFGESFQYRRPVSQLIWDRLALSFALSFSSAIFSWLIAIPIGVYSATHRYSIPDYIITFFQFFGVAIPAFLLALVLMTVASRVWGQDIGGLVSNEFRDQPMSMAKFLNILQHLWIPIVVISIGSTAWLTRVMRANLLDVLNSQYIQTARAKGLAERRVIWKHAVRNSLHPLIMALGGILPALISGEVIASIVLNLPTVGPLMGNALIQQDMYLAITLLMFLSVALLVGNLLADLLLAWIDPRVTLE